jgi:hypothetical protein
MSSMDILRGAAQKEGLLRSDLEKTRHASLIASRNGDYRLVAKLTKEAARLNQELASLQIEETAR